MFTGSGVALVTPMDQTGEIDASALSKLVDWHLEQATAALVITGTTGEGATLSDKEQQQLWRQVVNQVQGKIPVIAGTGTQATKSTIEKTLAAKAAGVDATLIVTPFYNKPTQEGVYQHFAAIAQAVPLPIILYNVPSRTGCDLHTATVARLSQLAEIIGLKDATGELSRVLHLQQSCASEFKLYSGDDATALSFMQLQGHGIISVAANVVPGLMVKLCQQAAAVQDWGQAAQLNQQLSHLYQALAVAPNPIPVKWALQAMDKIGPGIRLPLLPLAKAYQQPLREALATIGAMYV
jgi:4-hydroxy-tetrahydrodipicolinate synthase